MPAMLIAALMMQAAPPPPANPDADAADARCVVVMAQLDKNARWKDKSNLDSGMMFFLGKIVGRSGSAAVSPALDRGAQAVVAAGDEAALEQLATPCIAELNSVAAD